MVFFHVQGVIKRAVDGAGPIMLVNGLLGFKEKVVQLVYKIPPLDEKVSQLQEEVSQLRAENKKLREEIRSGTEKITTENKLLREEVRKGNEKMNAVFDKLEQVPKVNYSCFYF